MALQETPSDEVSAINGHMVTTSDQNQQKKPILLLDEEMSRAVAKAFTERLSEKFPINDRPYNNPPTPAIKITRSELADRNGAKVNVRVYKTGNLESGYIIDAISAARQGGVSKSYARYDHYLR